MESKWVLTAAQKKTRFRRLLSKRNSEILNANNPIDQTSDQPDITVELETNEQTNTLESLEYYSENFMSTLGSQLKIVGGL